MDPVLVELAPRGVHALGVAAQQVEQESFEVRRLRDVHRRARRRERLRGRTRTVDARAEEFIEHVVLVRRENETTDRHAHALGEVSREDVAEVARRHRDRDLLRARSVGRPQPCPEVVDDLRGDAREVDRVDRTEVVAALELEIVRQCLHEILRIVENALDGDVMDVLVDERVHLRALERAHASLRGQHEHVDAVFAAEGMLRRGSGVARCGTHDVQRRAAARERVFDDLAEELHRHVFECERRAFAQPDERNAAVDIAQRSQAVGEDVRAVRCVRHAHELVARNVGGEQTEHLGRKVGVIE